MARSNVQIQTADTTARFERQADIIPSDKLAKQRILVVGTGAIGSLVARQLAHIGCTDVTLVDFDTVDEVNLCCQGFTEADLGKKKVEAVKEAMMAVNAEMEVTTIDGRFTKSLVEEAAESDNPFTAIFCCVDKMEAREFIWKTALAAEVPFFVDGRMKGGDSIRIISANCEDSRKHYPNTLFGEAEAQVGSCTAKTTIYAANIASGLELHRFVSHLRGQIIPDPDLMINLAASEMGPAPKAAKAK